jgi:hypothetical protein
VIFDRRRTRLQTTQTHIHTQQAGLAREAADLLDWAASRTLGKSREKLAKKRQKWLVRAVSDFKAEIVFSTNNDSGFSLDAGIEVWGDTLDNWVTTRPVWNQHSYHITNVGELGEIPVNEAPNWSTPEDKPYNSYRRNSQGSADFCAPDLVPFDLEASYRDCPKTELCVWVANQGCLGVGPGVKVTFYEESLGVIGAGVTKAAIVAGAAEQVCVTPDVDLDQASVWAVVDDDGMMMGALNECAEDNNLTAPIPVCLIPK